MDRDPIDRSPIDRDFGITPTPAHYHPPVSFDFDGSLLAGKTVCIDGKLFSVLNDGVNAIADFDGDFPVNGINPAVIYSDGETARTVEITVTNPGPPSTTATAPTLTLTYAGALAVGETLCIDANDLTVLKNGVSDLANFTGDFPAIGPETNTITYTDSAGSRTMVITVTRKERSV
jgi:hypothetical protein